MKKYILAILLIFAVINSYSQSKNFHTVSICSKIDEIWEDWSPVSNGTLSIAYVNKLPTTIRIYDIDSNKGYLITNISDCKKATGSFFKTELFKFNYYSNSNGDRQILKHPKGQPSCLLVTKVKNKFCINIFWSDGYAEGISGR